MDPYERLKAELPQIAKAVNEFNSEQVQQQAFRALLQALGAGAHEPDHDDEVAADVSESGATTPSTTSRQRRRKKPEPKENGARDTAGRAGGRRRASAPSFDQDLNLRPKGAQSFEDFVAAKKPRNFDERNLASVYYILRITKAGPATVDKVYTCYKDRSWRVPADPRNSLAQTAAKRGWLNTKNMDDIKLTMPGENYVEHDLPPKDKA